MLTGTGFPGLPADETEAHRAPAIIDKSRLKKARQMRNPENVTSSNGRIVILLWS